MSIVFRSARSDSLSGVNRRRRRFDIIAEFLPIIYAHRAAAATKKIPFITRAAT